MLPSPFAFLVLALAAFRLTRLVGWDEFPPAVRARQALTGETVHHNVTDSQGPIYRWRRPTLAKFLACPYCVGFWIGLAVYLLWVFLPTQTFYAALPLALSAAVGITARMLDP
jgi:hypothetical protein